MASERLAALRRARWQWADETALRVVRVPWDSDRNWLAAARATSQRVAEFIDVPYTAQFARAALAMWVYDANRMEGTLSRDAQEGKTMKLILDFVDGTVPVPPDIEWDSEGGREEATASSHRQLYQAVAAARYLFDEHVESALSKELVIKAHEIMMRGSYVATREGKEPVAVGCLRDDVRFAGNYQFLPPSAVPRALAAAIADYNASCRAIHPIAAAVRLFYDIITIHPFQNGNGRLRRLLMAWSLRRDGFPFAVSFSSAHKKRRQHYIHAIGRARRVEDPSKGELNVILVASVARTLQNYEEHLRRGAA